MPQFFCESCNYKTSFSQNYNRHLKTKKHQANITKDSNSLINMVKTQKDPIKTQKDPIKTQKDPIKTQEFTCDYCEKSFSSFAHMRRHEIHRCKDNPNIINKILESKNRRIKKLEKDKEMLYKKISELISKVGDTNIQNNIIINNYGDEDMSHITDTIKNELLKIPYGAIPKLIESVHFNDKKPENKNIVMPNKKENILKIYHGDKWIYKNKNETIRDLIDSKYMIIDNHYDEVKCNISNTIQQTYSKFQKYYEEGDEELIKELKKECDFVLLNHRE